MEKDDNNWEISQPLSDRRRFVEINGEKYLVESEVACISHAILLLVDAVNDKKT